MQLANNFKTVVMRFSSAIRFRRRRPVAKTYEISAPFNFKHEYCSLPGVTDDELILLKEKAMASRIGVADPFSAPRPAPITGGPAMF